MNRPISGLFIAFMLLACAPALGQGTTSISALPSATTPLAGTEVLPIVQGGVTKKVPALALIGTGGGTPCVTTALSLQFNSAGALGCVAGATSDGTSIIFATGGLKILGSSSGTVILNAPATGGGTLTLPPGTDTLAGLAATQTLTNKTISGASNTLSNIGNASLTNSSLSIAGNSVSLGASLSATTLTASLNVFSSSLQGLVPASGGGTSNFLRADGTWAAPPGGGSVSVTSASGNLVVNPSPGTGTFTIGTTVAQSARTSTSESITSTDAGKTVTANNASAQAYSIAQATGSLGAGFGTDLWSIGGGTLTLTAAGGSLFDNGLATLVVNRGQDAYLWSDGTNYHSAISLPVMATNTLLGNSSGSSNYPTAQAMGTGVLTALSNNLSAAGGMTTTVASGTATMGTSAIASGACATAVTVAATGVATTDVIMAGFNGDPTGITGFTPATTGGLYIVAYPSSNNVNFKECNPSGSSITPGAHTLNWRVGR